MYYSHDEVFKQGDALKKTYEYVLSRSEQIKEFFAEREYDEIIFLGCGSSYWLSMSACKTMQKKTGIKASALKSGEVVLNPDFYTSVYNKPLIISPSRSGTTEETITAIQLFKQTYGSAVVSIVEYENSPIELLSDLTLYTPWANETSVCQTRSFSNLYLACIMMTVSLTDDVNIIGEISYYLENFDTLSKDAESRLNALNTAFTDCSHLVTLGCSYQYGVAIEGAYIAIEMAQFPSNYYSLLEFRHGPIVMVDDTYLVTVFSRVSSQEHEEQMAKEARARGAKILAITGKEEFEGADYLFSYGKDASDEIIALYGIMVMQGFAHLKALDKGIDPDHPKGLIPFITLQ